MTVRDVPLAVALERSLTAPRAKPSFGAEAINFCSWEHLGHAVGHAPRGNFDPEQSSCRCATLMLHRVRAEGVTPRAPQYLLRGKDTAEIFACTPAAATVGQRFRGVAERLAFVIRVMGRTVCMYWARLSQNVTA
jgi:hypothetical protein